MAPYSDLEVSVVGTVSPSGPKLAGRHGLGLLSLAATDPMGLNDWLDDGRHFIAIPDAPDGIAQTLAPWLDDPQRLYRLAETGRRRFVEVWGEAAQMTPRLDLIGELVARERAGA